ncbi:MAG: hypothetical protein IJF83_10990 [Methanobrevibacter sp.]|nr:hypothetical protein [Methanobrevibacter sp.]
MKSNNQYLRTIAQKTGNTVDEHRSNNYYLKRISETVGTSDFSGSYNDLTDVPSTFTPSAHNHTASDITDFPVLEFVVITDNKPTASEDTMNRLYIVSENNKVNAYYSVENNNSYSWKQLDEDILDNITIPTDVADLTDNNDTAFTPKEHSHSYNDLTNKPSLFSGNYNDLTNKPTIPSDVSDLSDNSNTQFTPKSHTHTESEITDLGDYIEKSNTVGLVKNDGTIDTSTYLTEHQDITGKLDIAQTSSKGKNVVVDGTTGNITFENKPSIPSDVSDLTDTHDTPFTPKSHSHTSADMGDLSLIEITIEYNDGTTETLNVLGQIESGEEPL